MKRRQTKEVKVGSVNIGGNAGISIQSMTNTDTRNPEATLEQIWRLEEAGCDLVRMAVPDMDAAYSISKIRGRTKIPLVADIHFDYRIALECIDRGVDKIRINPGNIGEDRRVREVSRAAKEKGVPIRIGVNSGSIEKELLDKYGSPTPEAMVESAIRHVRLLEEHDFTDIIISLKASNVPMMIEAYRLISQKVDYPLHLGVTEAGTIWSGTIKSSIGIGTLLMDGIGDTIRVSLTGDPVEEVKVGIQILKSLGLRKNGIELISCPTCGRCQIDLINIANTVEQKLQNSNKNIKVAVMGCAVNGPGEAREADIGIAGGNGVGLIFKKGEIIKKVPEDKLVDALMEELETI
ncbi:flavodoxin-dependent (E)-4-hydroxy-3-methylbut-2-enyl-diphosphate synthase [Petroclostridium sp. X23]|uniref:flavodoxin-dependent (E)-4-hydroxy-3-methylbut-2-enyl-diphosphate synthase n=1 Tax=Petroclostridium sp. X23 TaxID=3045146 RepID=UPI0024ADC309|nr:flavodoxin-dependent (E)-4-hydroxy-3-methylbut-2-enyl-diphosphate synthase [Petroclostridium sp. X23]WHH61788.1 flavodoxin-dependent (E)-4-hydroxy-3-methylbut-2-enyl-diphosphate synthase [Petroclostridium sp. X23]